VDGGIGCDEPTGIAASARRHAVFVAVAYREGSVPDRQGRSGDRQAQRPCPGAACSGIRRGCDDQVGRSDRRRRDQRRPAASRPATASRPRSPPGRRSRASTPSRSTPPGGSTRSRPVPAPVLTALRIKLNARARKAIASALARRGADVAGREAAGHHRAHRCAITVEGAVDGVASNAGRSWRFARAELAVTRCGGAELDGLGRHEQRLGDRAVGLAGRGAFGDAPLLTASGRRALESHRARAARRAA